MCSVGLIMASFEIRRIGFVMKCGGVWISKNIYFNPGSLLQASSTWSQEKGTQRMPIEDRKKSTLFCWFFYFSHHMASYLIYNFFKVDLCFCGDLWFRCQYYCALIECTVKRDRMCVVSDCVRTESERYIEILIHLWETFTHGILQQNFYVMSIYKIFSCERNVCCVLFLIVSIPYQSHNSSIVKLFFVVVVVVFFR